MDAIAKVSSKGQVTVPAAVRKALDLEQGDSILFRVEGERVLISRNRRVDELAGIVEVPPSKKGAAWDEIRKEARAARAKARH